MNYRVIVGDHNWSVPDGEQYINVISILIHPNYQPGPTTAWANDYSILKLANTVTIPSITAGLACLPSNGTETFTGASLISSGWGNIQGGGPLSQPLKAANFVGVSEIQCQSFYGTVIGGSHICANGVPTNTTCQGDSGGNLIKTYFLSRVDIKHRRVSRPKITTQ